MSSISFQAAAAATKGFIDQYMAGRFANTYPFQTIFYFGTIDSDDQLLFFLWFPWPRVRMKCIESEEEEPTHSTEEFYQLSCFIEKGLLQKQNKLHDSYSFSPITF
jgi:hypothetical protein